MTPERKHHCKDCIFWRDSVKAGNILEQNSGRSPAPLTITCMKAGVTTKRLSICDAWMPVPVEPTCYNCIHLDHDDGRAHLYGYGFCTVRHQDNWVNVETKRTSCKHHEFRGNNNEHNKSK